MKNLKHWMLLGIGAIAFIVPNAGDSAPLVVQVKSFIQAVDLTDPSQFDVDSKSCQIAMSALVTCGTIGGESPSLGNKSEGKYPLWSSVKADVTCAGNKVTKWDVQPVERDAGKEFVFITTTGEINMLCVSP